MRRNPARTFTVLLSGSAVPCSLFVIGSTLTFAWPLMAKALIIVSQVGLVGMNALTIRGAFR